MLVVYCDPKKHGVDTYEAVLKSLVRARRKKPIALQSEGQEIFAMISFQNLFFFNILEDTPAAFLLKSQNDPIDVFSEYMPHL